MTGAAALNLLCGSATIEGLLRSNYQDTIFRTTVLGWLNLVLKDIALRQDGWHWRFLEKYGSTFNTAANDFDYALATIASDMDTTKVITVYDKTTDTTYRYMPYEILRKLIADESTASGNATHYSIFGGYLLIYPRPSSIVATYIDYIRVFTDATDAASALDIPSKYDPVVIDGCMMYAQMFDPKRVNPAINFQAKYEAGIENMKRDSGVSDELKQTISHRNSHELEFRVDRSSGII